MKPARRHYIITLDKAWTLMKCTVKAADARAAAQVAAAKFTKLAGMWGIDREELVVCVKATGEQVEKGLWRWW